MFVARVKLRRAHKVVKAIVVAVTSFGLSGCWPALKVVQPRAEVRVASEAGAPIEGAEVTFVSAKVFPGWHRSFAFLQSLGFERLSSDDSDEIVMRKTVVL